FSAGRGPAASACSWTLACNLKISSRIGPRPSVGSPAKCLMNASYKNCAGASIGSPTELVLEISPSGRRLGSELPWMPGVASPMQLSTQKRRAALAQVRAVVGNVADGLLEPAPHA